MSLVYETLVHLYLGPEQLHLDFTSGNLWRKKYPTMELTHMKPRDWDTYVKSHPLGPEYIIEQSA